MELDDELCLCFHVTKRKVLNFLRVQQPRRASQLSQWFGAGTGCGWCRKLLCALFEAYREGRQIEEPSWEEHCRGRAQYIRAGGGTPPPGATPIDQQPQP